MSATNTGHATGAHSCGGGVGVDVPSSAIPSLDHHHHPPPPSYGEMSVEELTRELARHGMKPGPRGYMVGALLEVWAATTATTTTAIGYGARAKTTTFRATTTTTTTVAAPNAAAAAAAGVVDDAGDDDNNRSGSEGDRNLFWGDDDDYDGGGGEVEVEVENREINVLLNSGSDAAPPGPSAAAPKKRKATGGAGKSKSSKPMVPLEDRLGLWIKSQPELYDRVLMMETVDVDELLEALVAESAAGGGVGCKVPRTKLLAYLEAEGVAVQQTKSRQAKQARYGNVHF